MLFVALGPIALFGALYAAWRALEWVDSKSKAAGEHIRLWGCILLIFCVGCYVGQKTQARHFVRTFDNASK